jgi:cytochrome c oxidase subunit II
MIDPRGKIVKGFKAVMPTYKGRLAAPEAAALVEFIKSLRTQNLENVPSKEAIYEPVKPAPRR